MFVTKENNIFVAANASAADQLHNNHAVWKLITEKLSHRVLSSIAYRVTGTIESEKKEKEGSAENRGVGLKLQSTGYFTQYSRSNNS